MEIVGASLIGWRTKVRTIRAIIYIYYITVLIYTIKSFPLSFCALCPLNISTESYGFECMALKTCRGLYAPIGIRLKVKATSKFANLLESRTDGKVGELWAPAINFFRQMWNCAIANVTSEVHRYHPPPKKLTM